MFTPHDDSGYQTPVEGIEMKTLVHGEKTLLTRFKLTEGALLPAHAHPNEQTGYLVSGKIRLHMGDEVYDVGPGDAWCIAPDMTHRAEILEDSVAVEVFSPVREDYLPDSD